MNNVQSCSAVLSFQNYKLKSNNIRILAECRFLAALEKRFSGGLYTCSSKVKMQKNVNIVKGFIIIADLKHMSILWIRFGDICLDYSKPTTVKFKVFRRQ